MSFVATEVPVASSGPSSFFALLWSRFSFNLSVSFPELTYPRGEGALFCRLSLTLDPEKLLDFSLKTRPALASSTPHGKRNAARHPDEPWCQSRGEDEVVEGSRVSKEGRSGRRDSVGVGSQSVFVTKPAVETARKPSCHALLGSCMTPSPAPSFPIQKETGLKRERRSGGLGETGIEGCHPRGHWHWDSRAGNPALQMHLSLTRWGPVSSWRALKPPVTFSWVCWKQVCSSCTI